MDYRHENAAAVVVVVVVAVEHLPMPMMLTRIPDYSQHHHLSFDASSDFLLIHDLDLLAVVEAAMVMMMVVVCCYHFLVGHSFHNTSTIGWRLDGRCWSLSLRVVWKLSSCLSCSSSEKYVVCCVLQGCEHN